MKQCNIFVRTPLRNIRKSQNKEKILCRSDMYNKLNFFRLGPELSSNTVGSAFALQVADQGSSLTIYMVAQHHHQE